MTESEKIVCGNPFAYNHIENEKFVPFYEQREAGYIDAEKNNYKMENDLKNFRNEMLPVDPQLDIVDGYKTKKEIEG